MQLNIKRVIAFTLLVLLLISSSFVPTGMSIGFIGAVLIAVMIFTLLFFWFDGRHGDQRNWASLTVLFVFGYIIVHFQLALLLYFGFEFISDFQIWLLWADEDVVNKSVAFSALGLIAFYTGHLSATTKSNNYDKTSDNESASVFFLLAVSYISYLAFFVSSGSYMKGAYYAGDASSYSNYLYLIFNGSLMSAIIIKLRYISSLEIANVSPIKYVSYFGLPLVLLVGWHLLFSSYVGDRGPILSYVLLCSSLYFYRVAKMNFVRLVVILLVGSIAFTAMKEVRTRDASLSYQERASQQQESNSKFVDENIPGSSLIELAYSGRAFNHALANVPENYNYRYGYFQIMNVVAIIPGLGGVYWKVFGDSEARYNGSSGFITFLIQGEQPTYGDGTSTVADLYLDFGIFGIVIGLFIFGLFVAKFEHQLYQGRPDSIFSWIAALTFLSTALYIGRSSITLNLQAIFLIYVMIKLNSFIMLTLRRHT